MKKTTYVSVDIETRSKIDLKKAGLHRYAEDESTELLCFSWLVTRNQPYNWNPDQELPKFFLELVKDPSVIFTAWNAQFEIENWLIQAPYFGLPAIPPERWHCTQGDAAMSAFPLALGKCAKALKLPWNQQKDSAGTRLITKLCKPITTKKYFGKFREKKDFTEDYEQLYGYCDQDVVAESAIFQALPARVSGFEDEIQRYTWLSNRRGVPVDSKAVKVISERLSEHLETLDTEIQLITDNRLNSPRQRDAVLKDLECNREAVKAEALRREKQIEKEIKPPRWLVKDTPDIYLGNLRGETIDHILNDPERIKDFSEYDIKMIRLRRDVNHSSTAKFKKIMIQLCKDHTVKGNIQYHGAATGRDAARGFQIQNLPRNMDSRPETTIKVFRSCSAPEIDCVMPLLEQASQLIRPMICAPKGKKLIVSDYGQVEARGTAWVCRDGLVLEGFRQGLDPYKVQAAQMYGVYLEDVDKEQRQYGKLATLACGYQGSHKALTKFAEGYGLIIERKEAAKVVKLFRESRPLLLDAWKAFNETAQKAINSPSTCFQVPGCQTAIFQMRGQHLTLTLPSNRQLWYPYARIEIVRIPYEDADTGEERIFETVGVTRRTQDTSSHWVRQGISGGNLLQNWVQASCRDIMMEAVPRLEKAGYETVMRIHDEIGCLTPDTPEFSIEEMDKLMGVLPKWCKDFPVTSDGYESKRYRK